MSSATGAEVDLGNPVPAPDEDPAARQAALAAIAAPAPERDDGEERITADLVALLLSHVDTEDLLDRAPDTWRALVLSMVQLADARTAGAADVAVFTPTRSRHGWTGRHSLVQISTDDMPFLVDSVTGLLARQDRTVQMLLHPMVGVRRDADGRLLEVGAPGTGDEDESWISIEIDRDPSAESLERLRGDIVSVLSDVRLAVGDWRAMRERAHQVAAELQYSAHQDVPRAEIESARRFLQWLADDHFTFLGYREYELVDDDTAVRSLPGSGLGILRIKPGETTLSTLRPEAQRTVREPRLLTITKANTRSTVHRPVYLDYVGVRFYAEDGTVTERRFLGLLTSSAYNESVTRLPLIEDKVAEVLALSGFPPASHSARDLLTVLEDLPRDELLQTSAEHLTRTAVDVVHLQERRRSRLYVRRDEFGRFASVLVYIPRDRYTPETGARVEQMLRDAFDADSVDYTTRMSDSALAQVHYVIRVGPDVSLPDLDVLTLRARLQDATRTWEEGLLDRLEPQDDGEVDPETERELDEASGALRRWAHAFPEAYKEDFDAATGVADLARVAEVLETGEVRVRLYRAPEDPPEQRRLKLYRTEPSTLSEVLPIFTHLGLEVLEQRPYGLDDDSGTTAQIDDFALRARDAAQWQGTDGEAGEREIARAFEEVFLAVTDGHVESDALNGLVLTAGLDWRRVVVLRTVGHYLRQVGTTFSLDYLEEALVANPDLAALVVELFEARFDPEVSDRDEAQKQVLGRIEEHLDAVSSLDHDRIVRAHVQVIRGALRTNYFQVGEDGLPKSHVVLKLDPRAIAGLPEPRPAFEIWVYSPRVEGVHLRFGAVARGGLRWSDRREDFRTEVLGLVKAQMVKNAVIVPTGSKGGFVPKVLPDPAQDRDGWRAEGVACYRVFISGLLDVTDNRVDGAVVPPPRVVRHDGDDSYLVVAADKGTATFSDLANEVARSYRFWLDDAFASGGSAGYDHKAMGITARGAWVAVQRHFREMGIDTQAQDFTVVGIGDMSGDVFGNGMLCSPHIRLVAAFDHRDVFIDPDPDAATGFAERQRLFDLAGSSWQDYDRARISEGGGVFSRSAKAVPVTAQMRTALGLEDGVRSLTPAELIGAILRAPVDLLFNGGVGTYVKSSQETDLEVGDRANDAVRVDGVDLRCQVVAEGGNLGLTQAGRIEAAFAGVRLNTDAIDNSAGVDTSDHEVNIKIPLTPLVHDGTLASTDRDALLESMTDEVARDVLRDNYEQNILLQNAGAQRSGMLRVHARLLRHLQRHHELDRELEDLPSEKEIARREREGLGLTSPEASVLLSHAKLAVKHDLTPTDLVDDPWFEGTLLEYFPPRMREAYPEVIGTHPLRREIIVNSVANSMINRGGITFAFRAAEETGATTEQIARAYVAAREIFDLRGFVTEVEALDNVVDSAVQTELYLEFRRLMDRATRWFLHNRPLRSGLAGEIERYAGAVAELTPLLPEFLRGEERERYDAAVAALEGSGVPAPLAQRTAALLDTYSFLDIVDVALSDAADAQTAARDVASVAGVYFAASERFRMDDLLTHVSGLPRDDRWDSLARGALRDDLYALLEGLSRTLWQSRERVNGDGPVEPEALLAQWTEDHADSLARVQQMLVSIHDLTTPNLAALSVALRTLRGLVRQGASDA